jgi:hypothetical protein
VTSKAAEEAYPGLRDALAEAGNEALHYRPGSYSEHRDLDVDEMVAGFTPWLVAHDAELLDKGRQSVVIHGGVPDMETRVALINEGFESAMAQGHADDPALADDWLAERDERMRGEGRQSFLDGLDREALARVIHNEYPDQIASAVIAHLREVAGDTPEKRRQEAEALVRGEKDRRAKRRRERKGTPSEPVERQVQYDDGEWSREVVVEPVEHHDHQPVQHRDGKPPWCNECGLTAQGEVPVSRIGKLKPPVERPAAAEVRDALTLIARDVHLYDEGPNQALTGPGARRIADAILARFVVTPRTETDTDHG